MLDLLLSRIPLWVPWLCIGFGILAVIGIVVWIRWEAKMHRATAGAPSGGPAPPTPTPPTPPSGGAGAVGGTGGTGSAQPPSTATSTTPPSGSGGQPHPSGGHREIKESDPASLKNRVVILFLILLAIAAVSFFFTRYVLHALGVEKAAYTNLLSLIASIGLAVSLVKVFLRTISVYEIGHTEDMLNGKLRKLQSGATLLLPTEVVKPENILPTEAKVIPIDAIVTPKKGGPMKLGGFISYAVDPDLSQYRIKVDERVFEGRLHAAIVSFTQAEVGQKDYPADILGDLLDAKDAQGTIRPGMLSRITRAFRDGVTETEKENGIRIVNIYPLINETEESKNLRLKRLEDELLAESAQQLKDRNLEKWQVNAMLLNDQNSKLSHEVVEEQETGERTQNIKVDVKGTAGGGQALADLIATGQALANAWLRSQQGKGGGGGGGHGKQRKGQKQQQTGGQNP